MSNDEKKGQSSTTGGPLDKFEPGGELGPIEDRNEYERRFNSLPPDQKELAQESARFADLCQYFSQQKIDLPLTSWSKSDGFRGSKFRSAFAP